MPEPRRLTSKMKDDIRKRCQEETNSPANRQAEGELLALWVISLLENGHLYPEWWIPRRGHLLSMGDLRCLEPGAWVWMFYKEEGEDRPRINEPMKLIEIQPSCWLFDDDGLFGGAASGVAEFSMGGDGVVPDDVFCQCETGEGTMQLFKLL